MDPARFALQKTVISGLVTLLVLFGGWYAYKHLPRFEDPEFIIREAQIITPYPGASAQEVADEVTDPLENALQQLTGIDEIRSISTPGLSEVTVAFTIASSPNRRELTQRFTQMRSKVSDTASRLPPNAGPSSVFDDYGDVYALYYSVVGDGYSLPELYEYTKDLQQELVLVPGVSKVVMNGVPEQVIYVEYVPSKLAQIGMSADQISQILSGQNLVVSAGSVKMGDMRLAIRPSAVIGSLASIEDLLITDPESGASYRLSDIATVTRGVEDPMGQRLLTSGKPAIGLGISNVVGGNVVEMGAAIRSRIDELEGQRPLGIEIKPISDQGVSVKASVNDFVMNVVIALVIVVGTLLIFMGIRSGLLMGGILLVTVAGTLLGMYLGGLDMQRISLGALIIALGMLVDNAIVVVEGTLVRAEKGEEPSEAVVDVVEKTKWPLLGGTIVGILAFSAIGFSPDTTGEYAGSLFWTIAIALLFSWVVSVWLTPWYCTLALKKKMIAEHEKKENFLLRYYRVLLGVAIRFRWVTVVLTTALLISAILSFRAVPQGFFPASTRAQFVIDYNLPPGTDSSRTARDIRKIEDWTRQLEGVTDTYTSIGGGHLRFMLTYTGESAESSYGQILADTQTYEMIDGLLPQVRAYLEDNYPSAQVKVWKFVLGPGGGSKIEARFTGPDPKVLRSLTDQAKVIFAEEKAVAVKQDWRDQKQSIRPIINESAARRVGLSQSDIAEALAAHFDGANIGLLREKDELRRIIFRPDAAYRSSPEQLRDVHVYSAKLGSSIPIAQVVDGFETVFEDYKIRRYNRAFAIKAQADPAEGVNTARLQARVKPKVEAIELPPGYHLEWRGVSGDSSEAQAGLASTFPFGFAAMIIVIFIQFNKIRQPLIILFIVPMALIGVVYGLVAVKAPLDFMGILGVLSLSGMLIKNAIVLLDETDVQVASGKARMSAVIDSAVSRFRPVMLGVITTVLGVMPLLPDVFFRSLSVVIMCGLSFATLLTLIVVPTLYTICFNVRPNEVEETS